MKHAQITRFTGNMTKAPKKKNSNRHYGLIEDIGVENAGYEE